MKRLLFAISSLMITLAAYAQYGDQPTTKVDWNGIKLADNIVIGISFDVTEAKFGGLSYEDRCEVDPELKTDLHDIVARCVNSANDEMNKYIYEIYFSPKVEGKDNYIVFKVKTVGQGGWVIADAKLVTPSGVATITDLYGKGGVFGTFMNLFGDGCESLGKDIAKRIAKAKYRKKI